MTEIARRLMAKQMLEWMFENPKEAEKAYTEFRVIQNFKDLPIGESINQLYGLRLIKKDENTIEIIGSILVSVESFNIFRQTVEPILKKYGISASFTNYYMKFTPHDPEKPSKII